MAESTDLKPLELPTLTVLPEWIDYNGHMNVAYYVLAFDHGVDAVSYTHLTLPTKA